MNLTFDGIAERCRILTESRGFRGASIAAILASGVTIGFETSREIVESYGSLLQIIDAIILWIFTAELSVRILAFGRRPWRFFADPWNAFDASIVVLCHLPLGVNYVSVLRLVRTLRILRLLTALPKLQQVVGAFLRSVPGIGYVGVLLGLHLYIYAVLGVFAFGGQDPAHFGSLPASLLTLFQILTLEGWADIMRAQSQPILAPIYFCSFIVLGTMIILNLFIGVIMNGMQETDRQSQEPMSKDVGSAEAFERLEAIMRELESVKNSIRMK